MKKILIFAAVSCLLFTGCSKDDVAAATDPSKQELFRLTDKYVRWLDSLYDSFGISDRFTEKTSDGKYQVAGVGRMIAVKIMKYVPDSEYETLERELYSRYKDDRRVNDVYINGGGTITIDCRD